MEKGGHGLVMLDKTARMKEEQCASGFADHTPKYADIHP